MLIERMKDDTEKKSYLLACFNFGFISNYIHPKFGFDAICCRDYLSLLSRPYSRPSRRIRIMEVFINVFCPHSFYALFGRVFFITFSCDFNIPERAILP